ncbi:unnamed protein product [Ilex paraguariensis]|uniref:Uncharacterized protein n=1 Tax=Ilex paraguariensis TaxID=185542 RepID=A0ABC8TGP3_9AQUA
MLLGSRQASMQTAAFIALFTSQESVSWCLNTPADLLLQLEFATSLLAANFS